jgi:hypothetical protein
MNPIRYGQSRCSKCGEPASRDVVHILDARLEAAGGEFTEMRRRVKDCTLTLALLGGVYFVQGLYTSMKGEHSLGYFIVGTGTCVAAYAVAERPVPAMAAALALWGVQQTYILLTLPLVLLHGLLGRVGILVFLCRGLYGAIRVEAIRRSLAAAAAGRR